MQLFMLGVFSKVEQCCQYITPTVLLARLILRFSEHSQQLPVYVTAKKTDQSSSCMLISGEHKLCSRQHTLIEDEESFSYPPCLFQTEVLLLQLPSAMVEHAGRLLTIHKVLLLCMLVLPQRTVQGEQCFKPETFETFYSNQF